MKGILHRDPSLYWIITLSIIQLAFILGAFAFDMPILMLIPAGMLFLVYAATNVYILYILFALVLPFSVEMELPGGLGTDLPAEQVMWLLSGFGVVYLATKPDIIREKAWLHPVSLLLIAHILWIGLTAFLSQDVVISAKFLVAKVWYVIPFFFLYVLAFRDNNKVYTFFKAMILAMMIAIVIIMIRHAGYGFSFRSINEAVHPIFRNHVNYACMLVALIPYVWAISRKNKSIVWYLIGLTFLVAIYLSFTRAAMVALIIGVGTYFIIRWKAARPSIIVVLMSVFVAIPYLLHNNRYLDYAPDYERAIAHYRFDNLIEATYRFEDISTMERLYRWVAGKEMVADRPVFGFGPNTFYSFYQDYTISEFQTYVSNNPEKSGIHNYYLMTMVEQGVPGLIIFGLLVIAGIIYGENAYHRIRGPEIKTLVMAATVSLVIISSILIINDMVETDKVGPFFFIALAIIVISKNLHKMGSSNKSASNF